MNWNEKTPPNSLKSSAAQEEPQETEKSCAAGETAPTRAKSRNRPQRFRLRCFRQNVSQLPLLYSKWESFAIRKFQTTALRRWGLKKTPSDSLKSPTAWRENRRSRIHVLQEKQSVTTQVFGDWIRPQRIRLRVSAVLLSWWNYIWNENDSQ